MQEFLGPDEVVSRTGDASGSGDEVSVWSLHSRSTL
jgi:hypothetical protein